MLTLHCTPVSRSTRQPITARCEEEARELLRMAVAQRATTPQEHPVDIARRLFESQARSRTGYSAARRRTGTRTAWISLARQTSGDPARHQRDIRARQAVAGPGGYRLSPAARPPKCCSPPQSQRRRSITASRLHAGRSQTERACRQDCSLSLDRLPGPGPAVRRRPRRALRGNSLCGTRGGRPARCGRRCHDRGDRARLWRHHCDT